MLFTSHRRKKPASDPTANHFGLESLETRQLCSASAPSTAIETAALAAPSVHASAHAPARSSTRQHAPNAPVQKTLLGAWDLAVPYTSEEAENVVLNVTSLNAKRKRFSGTISNGSLSTTANGRLGKHSRFTLGFTVEGIRVSAAGSFGGDALSGTYKYSGGTGSFTAKRHGTISHAGKARFAVNDHAFMVNSYEGREYTDVLPGDAYAIGGDSIASHALDPVHCEISTQADFPLIVTDFDGHDLSSITLLPRVGPTQFKVKVPYNGLDVVSEGVHTGTITIRDTDVPDDVQTIVVTLVVHPNTYTGDFYGTFTDPKNPNAGPTGVSGTAHFTFDGPFATGTLGFRETTVVDDSASFPGGTYVLSGTPESFDGFSSDQLYDLTGTEGGVVSGSPASRLVPAPVVYSGKWTMGNSSGDLGFINSGNGTYTLIADDLFPALQ